VSQDNVNTFWVALSPPFPDSYSVSRFPEQGSKRPGEILLSSKTSCFDLFTVQNQNDVKIKVGRFEGGTTEETLFPEEGKSSTTSALCVLHCT